MHCLATCHRSVLSSLVIALVSSVFLSHAAWAAPVAYPDPRPHDPWSGMYSAITEGYMFSWTDLALADGGNPAGTLFDLYISEEGTGVWTNVATRSKATNEEETFEWDSGATLVRNTVYEWRVDVGISPGTVWQVSVPMIQPADGAERVGVYPRIFWDSHPSLSGVQEKLLLIDWDEGSLTAAARRWVTLNDEGAITGINGALVVKTYDTTPGSTGRALLREFWYFDGGYERLLPNRRYRMRVLYCDKDGNPLFNDLNGNEEKDAGEPYAWADMDGDFATGWEFRTVPELLWWEYDSSNDESVVIYWESMYGTMDRSPPEGDTHFEGTAAKLALIHETNHHPSIGTVIAGSEEITASYGGLHNDHSYRASCTTQAPWVPEITSFTGWYTLGTRAARNDVGFPPSQNYIFGAQDRYEEWTARGIRTFLQDAANGPYGYEKSWDDFADMENLQYVILIGDADRTAPSFYHYYSSGGHHWLATDFFYSSQDSTDNVNTTPRYQVSRIPIRSKLNRTVDQNGFAYDPELPFMTKIRDYATLLNSEAKKAIAYENWFGRAIVAAASTEYWKWYQFYNGFAQHLVSQRIPIGGELERDAFSGLKVRKYDIFGTGSETLTSANILKHINNPTDPDDVPGLFYLLCRGEWYSWYGDEADVTPSDTLSAASFSATYDPDPTDGRRPLLISPTANIALFENAIWGRTTQSIAESAMLAPGGPIGLVGFASSGVYTAAVSYTREFETLTLTETYISNFGDEPEGYSYPSIEQGVLTLEPSGDTDAFIGKLEFVRQFALEYGATTQPGIGNIFNHSLADYITNNANDLAAGEQRVTTTVLGANIIGDCALVMPMRQPVSTDNARPEIEDTNLRPATPVPGFGVTPRYNSQNIPVNTIPHDESGVPVTLNIETGAESVRVRVLTPFRQNTGYTPGYWYDTSGAYWTYTDPDDDGDGDPETCPTVDSSYTYTFTALIPSIYLVVVQAQNPAWVDGTDDPQWRWLQERWIYVQAVNEFVRDTDSNILVVDVDQHDRYYLNGDRNAHVEDFYVNPAMDAEGYEVGVEDPRTFPGKPALPLLNKELGEDEGSPATYKYQYWCANVYSTLEDNGADILAGKRYYGEITPAALKSFQDSRGVVLWFDGDNGLDMGDGSIYWPDGLMIKYEVIEQDETAFLTTFVENGGRLWLTSQSLSYANLWTEPFREYIPGALSQTFDTDYTNMDGLQDDTMSRFINDPNIEGGDGQSNADITGELDPTGIEAKSVFFWDTASGPGTITSSGSSAVQNRFALTGGRTIFFSWPFEAIDHIGDLDVDNSGRENVMRQIVDWLRSVPKPTPVNPLDGATGVSRAIILQWSRVAEASFYKVYIGLDPLNLTGPGAIVVRDNPWFDPDNPTNPADNLLDPNTHYYWRVDCLNADYTTVTAGNVWSFTTVAPAPKAILPNPEHMEEQVPVAVAALTSLDMFSWTNLGTVDTYDVYMWNEDDGDHTLDPTTDPDLLVGDDLPDPSYTPAVDLVPDKQYYWRVDSLNELSPEPDPLDPDDPGMGLYDPTNPSSTGVGNVWHFHTITVPPAPTEPDPPFGPPPRPLGTENVATTQLLSWKATLRTDSYDVFLWTGDWTTPPSTAVGEVTVDPDNPQARYQYDPGNLNVSTTYHWQVRPKNAAGRQNTVATWTFTTSAVQSPDRVGGMFPADGAVDVPVDVILTWNPASGAATYTIWFGKGGLPGVPTETGLTETQYDPPGDLDYDSTYVWRVDSVAADGVTTTPGLVLSFSTTSLVFPAATDPSPADGATGVAIEGLSFAWTGSGDAIGFDFYFGTNPDALELIERITEESGTFEGITLAAGTTYYWRVDSVYDDGEGGEIIVTGTVWSFTTAGIPAGGGGNSCFIATSAYEAAAPCGTAASAVLVEANCTGQYLISPARLEKLDDIRAWRDSVLLRLPAGRKFSAWYYAVGPYAADVIRDNEPAKAAVRAVLLDPLAALSRSCLEGEK